MTDKLLIIILLLLSLCTATLAALPSWQESEPEEEPQLIDIYNEPLYCLT